ncbi:MAG: dephospho-CoA kinase, partial [Candidatus Omnitrophica bacterium]|nr:dephospho-CoA kinase [Candidatus Omnitrophota bacterium]
GLDPRKIAKIVFSDSRRRKTLESVIHPYVFERIADEIGQAEEKVVIADVPLLFESGYDRFCDKTIVVKATEEVMRKRLCEKGFTREEIDSRWKAQLPLAEKIERADEVIDNSETFQKTRTRVEEVWKTLHSCPKGAK